MSQSILTNTTVASLGRVVNVILGIATTAILTRWLGVNGYGSYALLLSYGALLLVAADFGLYLTLTREIAQTPQHSQAIFSRIASLRLVLLVVAIIVAGVVALVTNSSAFVAAYLIMAAGFACQSFSQLFMGIYQTHQVVWRATLGDIAGRLLQLGGLLAVFFFGARLPLGVAASPLLTAALWFTLGSAVAVLLHRVLLPMALRFVFSFKWSVIKPTLAASWPLAAMLALNVVYFRVDIFVLSAYRSAAEVGWYGLAYKIIESALFFPAMFGGLLLPGLSAAAAQHKVSRMRANLSAALRLLCVVSVLTLVLLWSLGTPIVVFLSGGEFTPAGSLLTILSLALFVMFFGNLFGFTLVALREQRTLLILYAALAGLNLVGNLLLVPSLGAAAAAWTTVATEAAAATVAGFVVWRKVGFSVAPAFLGKVVLAAAAAGITLKLLPPHLHVLIQMGAATVIFISVAAGLGALHKRNYAHL